MKKGMKFFLLLAILLLVVGSGMAIAGAVLGADVDMLMENVLGERLEKRRFWRTLQRNGILIGTAAQEEDEPGVTLDVTGDESTEPATLSDGEIFADSVRNLELDLKADELILRSWEKDMIQVKYEGADSSKGTLSVSDGTLTFTGTRNMHDREVILYYPKEKQFDHVSIKVDAGEVELESAMRAGDLAVSIGAGELSAEGEIYAEKTKLSVGAGAISMDFLQTGKLTGDCGMGSLELVMDGEETDYNYTLKCGLGEISVDGNSYASFGGKNEITNPGASYQMNLECGMGEIDIRFAG